MIHSSAIIHPKAQIGAGCEIGPFCVIGEHVTLGEGCRLHSHVVIDGHTRLGAGNEIFPFASIGLKTQDLKWKAGAHPHRNRRSQHPSRICDRSQRHERRQRHAGRLATIIFLPTATSPTIASSAATSSCPIAPRWPGT